jgi:WD40 repeat protein
MIALGSNDGTVTLWRLDGTQEPIIQAHTDVVYSVSFSSDGRMIASASRDGIVKLWNIDGKQVGTLRMEQPGHYSVSFSPDRKTIASAASINGIVKLWNIDDGKELQTFQVVHHPSWVTNLTFSPDGQIIASASRDGIVKLWNIDGKELHTFETNCDQVNSINFSRDGKTLAFASANSRVILWNLNLDDLLKRGCDWLRDYLKTNPNVSESDRHLCDGIGTQK